MAYATIHRPHIVCPWCGFEHEESWIGGDGGNPFRMECCRCNKPILVSKQHLTITYTTSKGEAKS